MPTNTETNNPSSDGPRTKRRKYVKRACKVCVAAKRSCSDGRPCERCVRLGKTVSFYCLFTLSIQSFSSYFLLTIL